jgi:hypothetical protein
MSPASFSSSTLTFDGLFAGPSDLIKSRKVTLLSGQNLVRGTVLGKKVTAGTIAGAADAGNTGGSGAIGTLSVGTGAQLGVYRAVCIEPAANAGTFAVFDPSGVEIGKATVAVAFTGQVNFTIADATDFVAGDAFSITVSAITEKYLQVAVGRDGRLAGPRRGPRRGLRRVRGRCRGARLRPRRLRRIRPDDRHGPHRGVDPRRPPRQGHHLVSTQGA